MHLVKEEYNKILISRNLSKEERIRKSIEIAAYYVKDSEKVIFIAPTRKSYAENLPIANVINFDRRIWYGVYKGIRIELETERTFLKKILVHDRRIFLAFNPSDKFLIELDYLPRAKLLVMIPDEKHDLKDWEDIWNHDLAVHIRERNYVPEACQQCSLLPDCGGGCPLALKAQAGTVDPDPLIPVPS